MAPTDMTTELDARRKRRPSAVTPPYLPDPDAPASRRTRWLIFAATTGFCLVYGMAFAFIAPYLLLIFAVPIVVLTLLVIWALPGLRRAPIKTLEWLFYAFFIVLVMWPNYLALALPGLPWITASRLTGLPMFVIFLICLSTSRDLSRSIVAALKASPTISILLGLFVFIQFYSIALSSEKGASFDKFITAQTTWTAVCLISCYVFQQPGRVLKWVYALWIMALLTGAIGILEHHQKHVFWSGHVPKILQIQDPHVLKQLAGTSRAYSNIYRTAATFGTSIDFAEYLSFTFPFLYHIATQKFAPWIRIAAALSIPYVLYIAYITGSRSGVLGFLVSSLLYVLTWGVIEWMRNRKSILGPAVVMTFPVMGLIAVTAVVVIGRLRNVVLGGGAAKASSLARIQQWQLGWPKFLHNPVGYGIGRGGETVGWFDPGGNMSIDSYYLLILIEYGAIGFVVFWSMILCAIYMAGREAVRNQSRDLELSFIGPAGIALVNFFMIRATFSQPNNVPIAFMLIGIVLALVLRARRLGAAAAPASTVARPRSVQTRPAFARRA